jgi:ubiquinone/menaquinone biosynthesis C-methylase UbiE
MPLLVGTAGRAIDIGCGSGWWLRSLAEQGVEPTRLCGVDAIPRRIAAARVAIPEADIRLAEAGDLPYPDGWFEVATLITVLSSLPDEAQVLQSLAEARRVLAPGGRLLCYEPRYPTPNPRTRLVGGRLLRQALEGDARMEPITLAPPLARRLGSIGDRRYRALSRVPGIRTHRLTVWERPSLD